MGDDLLKEKIRLELERKAIEGKKLLELKRLRVAEQNRIAVIEAVLSRYAHLAERIDGLVSRLELSCAVDDALREWFPALSDRIERIENVLILLLAYRRGAGIDKAVNVAGQAIALEHKKSLRTRLSILRRNLSREREKQASYGIDTPPRVENEIASLENQIEVVELELGSLTDD